MKKMSATAALLAVMMLVFVSAAFAANTMKAKPGIYDPDHTGIVSAAWVAGEGLPDGGNSNHALLLTKMGPTSANAASGATIDGAAGTTFTEAGFDVRNDGWCGAGSPRFNIYTDDGNGGEVLHYLGCSYGTHTAINADWTHVTFTGADAIPAIAPGSVITYAEVVFDEGTDVGEGFVYLDNIDLNGTIMGKPGNAK